MKSSIYKIFNLIIISSFSTFAIGQSLDLKDITSALGDLESPISKSKEEGSDEDQSDVEEMIKEEEDDLTSIVPDEDYLEIFQNLTDDQNNIIGELRSACYSPYFKKVIGIAMMKKSHWNVDQKVKASINGDICSGKVCDLPFI